MNIIRKGIKLNNKKLFLVNIFIAIMITITSCNMSTKLPGESSTLFQDSTKIQDDSSETSIAKEQISAEKSLDEVSNATKTASNSTKSSSLALINSSFATPAVFPTNTTPLSPDAKNKVLFGFYHVDPLLNQNVFEKLLDSDYVNCFVLTRGFESRFKIAEGAKKVKNHNKYAWLMISEAIFNFYPDRTELRQDWKTNTQEIVRLIREEGAWESILGFYFDEPYLWRITAEEFRQVTMYLQSAFQKRVFACFSIGAVSPSVWNDPSRIKQQVDAYNCQYLTDIAYDMYAPYNASLYQSVSNEMKQRMGNRSDLKVWYIPSTMNYLGNKTQQYSIDHLNGMLDLLNKESNPGGLLCFTYYTFPKEVEALGNVGLDILLNPDNKEYWSSLSDRIKEIGKEICNKT